MSRLLLKLGLFLLAGAIVNVAVAWGLAFAIPKQLKLGGVNCCIREPSAWESASKVFATTPKIVCWDGPGWSVVAGGGRPDRKAPSTRTTGWPCGSLYGEWQVSGTRYAWDTGSAGFPLLPLWPGLAINTIFYAAILWLLLAAPAAMGRRLRRRRGQCPACAYPVGASETCTECGGALSVVR